MQYFLIFIIPQESQIIPIFEIIYLDYFIVRFIINLDLMNFFHSFDQFVLYFLKHLIN